jgi:hypothetical protein
MTAVYCAIATNDSIMPLKKSHVIYRSSFDCGEKFRNKLFHGLDNRKAIQIQKVLILTVECVWVVP